MTRLIHCNRRLMIAGGLATVALPAMARSAPGGGLIAGTYAREGGKGVYPLHAGSGGWAVQPPIATIRNASFGVRSARHRLRYLLDESDEGSVGAYDESYRSHASRSTGGGGPCHAALAPDASALAVANYSDGRIALLPLDRRTGLPDGDAQIAQHEGRGPNAERQAGPHAHWVGFSRDGRWLHSVDLGADAVFAHRYYARKRALSDMTVAYRTPPGAGPRHLAWHPRLPVAYLASELSNTLTVLDAGADGAFRERRVMSTLPNGHRAPSSVAHIAMNAAGTRLYVSNRGHNSIAVFEVAANGDATPVQHESTGGHWPRFFLLLERRGAMLVANERSGQIATLALGRDGRLKLTEQRVQVPGVVFLAE